MSEMSDDLSGDHRVSRSQIVPAFDSFKPVLMTQQGWKNGDNVVWDSVVLTPIDTGDACQ
jgi:hypothetical protein